MFEFEWWIAAIVLLLGSTIQTAVGFGLAVVAAPIIVVTRPDWVPYIIGVMALVLSCGNAWKLRRDIQWRQIMPPIITRLPGTAVGLWVLLLLPVIWLQALVAFMVLVAVVVTAWAKPFAATPTNMGIAGFVSGITGTTTAIGGPPLALVMQHSTGNHARANLAVYFVYSCVVSLAGYYWVGLMTWEHWQTSLTFIPFALVGFKLGQWLQPWVDNRFRPILLGLCSASALVALTNATIGLLSHG